MLYYIRLMESLLSVGAEKLAEVARGAYKDYQSGRNLRLGSYKGHEGAKKLGHYSSSTGRRLGIYHQ
jgi:hypothetical protein